MRASLLLLAFGTLCASATGLDCDIGGFPTCAIECLLKAPRGKCEIIDLHCLCKNNKFIDSTAECVIDSCSDADIEKAIDAQDKTCKSGKPTWSIACSFGGLSGEITL